MIGFEEIERRFTFVAPDDRRRLKHEEVGEITKAMAHQLDALLPDGREKSLAITALEEVRMRANQAIATCVSGADYAVVGIDWATSNDCEASSMRPGRVEPVDTSNEGREP